MCFQRSRLLADNSTPSLAVRSNRAGSTESSYHLFRSEPAAVRILRAEVSLKINCLGSGKASDHTEPTCPQGAKGNQAQQRWLNRCLLNNKEGSIANQQINLFSSLLIWPPTSQWKCIKSMAAALLASQSGLVLYFFFVQRTKVRMLIPYWKWNHKLKLFQLSIRCHFFFLSTNHQPPTTHRGLCEITGAAFKTIIMQTLNLDVPWHLRIGNWELGLYSEQKNQMMFGSFNGSRTCIFSVEWMEYHSKTVQQRVLH